jgi:hypothetical protein
MDSVVRLLLCILLASGMFGVTMAVYTVGIAFGLCTWSPQLVAIVALNDIMVGLVIWKTLS